MYDKNAGYSGNVHGEMKLKKPAPNAKNKFTLTSKISTPLYSIVFSLSYQKATYFTRFILFL